MFNFRELAYDNNVEVIPWTDLKYVIIGMLFIHVLILYDENSIQRIFFNIIVKSMFQKT